MSHDIVPRIPPNMPQVPPNRFTRWMGRTFLRVFGWKIVGTLPDIPKLVMIVAPHSSNWDGIWGMAAKIAMGFQVRVLARRSCSGGRCRRCCASWAWCRWIAVRRRARWNRRSA